MDDPLNSVSKTFCPMEIPAASTGRAWAPSAHPSLCSAEGVRGGRAAPAPSSSTLDLVLLIGFDRNLLSPFCHPFSLCQLLAGTFPDLTSPEGTPVLIDASVGPLELCLFFWDASYLPLLGCHFSCLPETRGRAGGWAFLWPSCIESKAF